MCILKKKLEMTELKKFRVNSKGLEFIESAVENVITGVNFFLLPYFTQNSCQLTRIDDVLSNSL